MSKKKNTLKDLDEFLKQQAATLVPPSALSEKIEETIESTPVATPPVAKEPSEEVSAEKIINELTALSQKYGDGFRTQLYEIIIRSLESRPTSPEDKMLINTALYLKSGDKWKDAIKEYWGKKK